MGLDDSRLKSIDGWFAKTDLEIFKALLNSQASLDCCNNAVVEVGVHHGKSFVALATYSGDSKLYAIDLFEQQDRNIDQSGMGDRAVFLANLDEFRVDRSRVVIDARPSDEVQAADILDSVGPVRFFHIDGGHHYEAVKADLGLAVSVLAPSGVISVDDVFRPEWPEVSAATLGSGVLDSAGFTCFAIGFNKSYFCRVAYLEHYQKALRDSEYLSFFLTRVYRPRETEVLIFQQYPLPEWGLRSFALWALSVYKPDLYVSVKPIEGRVRSFSRRLKRSLTSRMR